MMLLFAVLASSTTIPNKPLDVSKLRFPEAIAFCKFSDGTSEFMFSHQLDDRASLSLPRKGGLELEAKIIKATAMFDKPDSSLATNVEVVAEAPDGRSITMLWNDAWRPMKTTLSLGKGKTLAGTCNFIPDPSSGSRSK